MMYPSFRTCSTCWMLLLDMQQKLKEMIYSLNFRLLLLGL